MGQMKHTAEEYGEAVSAQLRAERGASRMTVRELADGSGVTEQSLLRYLNGKRDVTLPVLYQICSGLGVKVPELLQRVDRRLAGDN